ncbi:MAG: carboxypeptidase regulatory-like domain-containing protein [Planctomycetes bacterium]|nr:carboxypeptidase regulatory-like domain-containing protein [Planctomycetota bacterium]
MNRSKLIVSLLFAIIALAAAIFLWNPKSEVLPISGGGNGAPSGNTELDQADLNGGNPNQAVNQTGREASAEIGAQAGPVAASATKGGSHQIRAVRQDGSPAQPATFLVENHQADLEWIDSDSGVLNLPDFHQIRNIAAFAHGYWSEPRQVAGDDSATSLDLALTLAAGSIELKVSREGSGMEADFHCLHRFQDRPQDLGEAIAQVFTGAQEPQEIGPSGSNLFHRAFRTWDPELPQTKGAQGHFSLSDLPPGHFQLAVFSQWGVPTTESLELLPGEHRKLEIILVTGGQLTGRVVGPNGNGVANATVLFRVPENNFADVFSQRRVRQILEASYSSDARNDLAHCDENGEFKMGPIPVGTGMVAAGIKELLPVIVEGVLINGGQSQSIPDIPLLTGHQVAIRALNAGNGEVISRPRAGWSEVGSELGIFSGPTKEYNDLDDYDAEGRVLLRNLPFEKLAIKIEAEGYAPKETEYLMPAENWNSDGTTPTIEVSLQPGLRVHGQVLEADTGLAVSDATVSALSEEDLSSLPILLPQFGNTPYPTTTSDESGLFVLDNLPSGEYIIQAQHEDFGPTRSELVSLAPGNEPELTILMKLGGTLIAHYVGVDGNSEPNRSIILVHLELGSRQVQATDQDGMAYFKGLPAGNFQIATLPGGTDPTAVSGGDLELDFLFVELAEGATEIVELGPGLAQCKLKGVITRAGAAMAKKSVTLLGTSGIKSTRSDENGEFGFEGLRAGDYSFFAGDATAPAFAGEVRITTGSNTLNIALPEGEIIVTVLKDSDGTPIGGVPVILIADNTRGGAIPVLTDANGVATFSDIVDGTYRVSAGTSAMPIFGGDPSLGSKMADVTVSNQSVSVEMRLEEGATFRARVVGPDNALIAGASMYYLRPDGNALSGLSMTPSNSKGVMEIPGLPAGPGIILVRHPEFGQAEINVNLTAGELSKQQITLQSGATIYVQVTDESDRPKAGVFATLVDSRGVRVSMLYSLQESQSVNQAYFSGLEQKMGPLTPGSYTLQLFRPGGKIVEYKVDIPRDTPELHLRYAYKP